MRLFDIFRSDRYLVAMANALPMSDMRTGLTGKTKIIATLGESRWAAIALAILLVALFRLTTPIARPLNDGTEYLKIASEGLDPHAQLAAPFAYRFAVPLFVHGVSVLTGIDPIRIFPGVAFLSCVALLLASYVVARLAGSPGRYALLTMLLMASSLFVVRFPLYFPFAVDVEALLVAFLAFALLLRRSHIAALFVSCLGLLFKEFLLAPLLVVICTFFIDYLHSRTNRPLLWTVISVVLTVTVFLLPRLLIPVTYSFGTILKVKAPAPDSTLYLSELRRFLAWPPRIGTFVNELLALSSFWLPALMLLTPARLRALWRSLGPTRILVVAWMVAVLVLTTVGGTNIMIFVTYSAPVLVVVLTLLFNLMVSKAEVIAIVFATLLFNRMIFSFGAPDGDLDTVISFYGAYSHLLDDVTMWRFAELTGWILLGWGIRRGLRVAPVAAHEVEQA